MLPDSHFRTTASNYYDLNVSELLHVFVLLDIFSFKCRSYIVCHALFFFSDFYHFQAVHCVGFLLYIVFCKSNAFRAILCVCFA